ncbi:MAG: response regulator [Ignavibacteriae bacterium]|nr:response regulator [Ignavibacteriota bacterium]
MKTRPVILLVEDDPIAANMTSAVITMEMDYHVVTAPNLTEAKQMAELYTPALFVVDLFLGDESGFDLVTWVRAHSLLHDAVIMMLTGAAEPQLKLKGYESGVDDYILKPFQPPEFLSRIRALMRIKGMQEELKAERAQLARLNAVLGENLDAITTLLLNIVSLRVPDAAARSQRAATFARWLCTRLDITDDGTRTIVMAARMHEIGKVVVGDGVLTKDRAQWTADDREAMAQFPLFGHMIVGNVEQLKEVGQLLRHQFENYDGTGLPDKLYKDRTPFGSRVLRVINGIETAFPSGLSDIPAVKLHLEEGRGTKYDPRLVQLALEFLTAVADPAWMVGKKEVMVNALQPGMKLAADIVTSNGAKLLPEGTILNEVMVERILGRHSQDPIITRAYVYA